MSWIEVSCEIDEDKAKSLSDGLEHCGAVAVSLYDASGTPLLEPPPGKTPLWQRIKLVGLFEPDTCLDALQSLLKTTFSTLDFEFSTLEERDWTRTWLDHFKPMSFGERLMVIPSNVAVVKLDPGLAFGTGTHPTTALCLRWLNDNPSFNTVIDYGCGSGILSIAALLLGAEKVWAIDYDPQALQSTQENAKRNDISLDKLITLTPEAFDREVKAEVILANILAEPLIALAPELASRCQNNGTIVLSGLLTHQIESVKKAYLPWFEFEEPIIEEDWVLLCAKRCHSLAESV